MVYNPAWGQRNKNNKRTPKPNVGGVKHSDIMKRRGVGATAPSGKEERTKHGFRKNILTCTKFNQYYECVYAGNRTNFGFSKKGFKTLKVEKGTIWLTLAKVITEGKGKATTHSLQDKDILKVQEGRYVKLPPEVAYSIATSADSNAELIVVETGNYEKDWKDLSPEEAVYNTKEEVLRFSPIEDRLPSQPREPRTKSKAYQQALKLKSQQQKQQTAKGKPNARMNANSSAAVGDNLKPMSVAELLAD